MGFGSCRQGPAVWFAFCKFEYFLSKAMSLSDVVSADEGQGCFVDERVGILIAFVKGPMIEFKCLRQVELLAV